MRVLGVACDRNGYSWALVDTSTDTLLRRDNHSVPANSTRSDQLRWLLLEFEALIRDHAPEILALKRAELGGSARDATLDHAEMDGVVLASAGMANLRAVSLKWANIARYFGVKSKSDALSTVGQLPISVGVAKSHLAPIAAAITGGQV